MNILQILTVTACLWACTTETITTDDLELRQPPQASAYVDGYHGAILGTGQQLTDTIEWHKVSRITVNGQDFVYDTYLIVDDELVGGVDAKIRNRMRKDVKAATGELYPVSTDVGILNPNGFITLIAEWFCLEYPAGVSHVIEFEVQLYVRGTSSWANQVYTYTRFIENVVPECATPFGVVSALLPAMSEEIRVKLK